MAYEFVEETGVIVADTSVFQLEVENEYKAVFGTDLDVDPETPEGVLITAEVTSRTGVATNNALLANQINPSIAGGTFLDALYALTGGTRDAATVSTFTPDPSVTGPAFPVIGIGFQAITSAGDLFEVTANIAFGSGGPVDVPFQSVETGAIPCPIDDLTPVDTGNPLTANWALVTITNVAATLGEDQQTDVGVRTERILTLALQGSGLAVSVFSHVRAVLGVDSLKFLENETGVSAPFEGVTLDANSIWACVSGGTDLAVALALLESKSGGCAWNNGKTSTPVSQVVVEPTSGQSYTVLFDRPDDVPMQYEVTIDATNISNPTTIITDAIVNYAAGLSSGQEGLVVGADVSPFEASGAINIAEPGLVVTLVRVKKVSGGSFVSTTIVIDPTEQASVVASSITVIISP